MPGLAREYRTAVTAALGIARAGEIIRDLNRPGSLTHSELSLTRLEALHEMAYLRIFAGWEVFIEATFLRMMCGYHSHLYTPIFAPGRTNVANLKAAKAALYKNRRFLLWHNPKDIRDRSRDWFSNSPHELVATSSLARLEWFAAVRHRIAHKSEDSRQQLDSATMNLCGQRFRGSSAGRFLRTWDQSASPRQRWLYTIGDELTNLAGQIAP